MCPGPVLWVAPLHNDFRSFSSRPLPFGPRLAVLAVLVSLPCRSTWRGGTHCAPSCAAPRTASSSPCTSWMWCSCEGVLCMSRTSGALVWLHVEVVSWAGY